MKITNVCTFSILLIVLLTLGFAKVYLQANGCINNNMVDDFDDFCVSSQIE